MKLRMKLSALIVSVAMALTVIFATPSFAANVPGGGGGRRVPVGCLQNVIGIFQCGAYLYGAWVWLGKDRPCVEWRETREWVVNSSTGSGHRRIYCYRTAG